MSSCVYASRAIMAETPDRRQTIQELEGPSESSPAERDQWESTELPELAHTRQNCTRISSAHALGPGSTAPAGLFGQLTYSFSKFWRRQISVTVDHVACRDHLGTYHCFSSFCRSTGINEMAYFILWNTEIQGRTIPVS